MQIDLVEAVNVGETCVTETLNAFEKHMIAEVLGGMVSTFFVVLVDDLGHRKGQKYSGATCSRGS